MNNNIFHFTIPGGGAHILSVILAATAIIIAYLIQKIHPPIIKLINALSVCLLGHYIYEDIFILVMGSVGRSTDGWLLYMLITVGIISFMSILNSSYRSYRLNNNIILSYSFLFVTFFLMYYTGWFHELQLWYLGTGGDPHNWLWAISKGVGLTALLPILRREAISKSSTKGEEKNG